MTRPNPLHLDTYYHIYNRGNNRENIFIEDKNYSYFLTCYTKYIEPVATTYAYSLLRNHFHFMIRLRTEEEQADYHHRLQTQLQTSGVSETPEVFKPFKPLDASRQFSNLFNAYARAINTGYQRTGSLFEGRFKRVPVSSDRYLTHLVVYIHRNAQKHGFVEDFRLWPHSSYRAILSTKPTRIMREEVLSWFGGRDHFQDAHLYDDDKLIRHLIADDD